jgi:hypothetical protein
MQHYVNRSIVNTTINLLVNFELITLVFGLV